MRRLMFWLGYLAIAAVICFAVLGFRFLNAVGAFRRIVPVHPGACIALAGVTGPEDLEIDRAHRLMFVSARDWREDTLVPNRADGLYVMHLDRKRQGFARLTPPSSSFHPHGLSLYIAPDGARTLMAINHPDPKTSTVEIYGVEIDGADVTLHHRASISSTRFVMLNDLVAVGPTEFYAASQASTYSELGQLFDTLLLRPDATILYYNGEIEKVAMRGLTLTAGINASPDYSKIYVSDSLRGRIVTIEGNPLTGWSEAGTLKVPGNPDNIDVDPEGNLWVASHLQSLKLMEFAAHPDRPSPSAVYKITTNAGMPVRVRPVYVDRGGQFGSASVGSAFDGHLYLGAVYENRVLDCSLTNSQARN